MGGPGGRRSSRWQVPTEISLIHGTAMGKGVDRAAGRCPLLI